MIIAIDGPAASGKGTLARRLAAHYGLRHLDTGLTFRAVAAALLARGLPLGDEEVAVATARNLDLSRLDREVLSAHEIGEAASRIAVLPGLARGTGGSPARLCGRRTRRGPRWTRHRHGRLPGRPGEALCNRFSRGARAPSHGGAPRARARKPNSPMCFPTWSGATRATRDGQWLPCVKRTMRTCSTRRKWI